MTILPEKLPEEAKNMLKTMYVLELKEIDSKLANELLVRASPKDSVKVKALAMVQQQQQQLQLDRIPQSLQKVSCCVFPMGSATKMSISIEDYICLEDESFLNDNIIEFYIRYA